MGATAFQRMRREQEALAASEQVEETQDQKNNDEVLEAALRAKAKELSIKSWHVKSIETLEKEIAELEKGGA